MKTTSWLFIFAGLALLNVPARAQSPPDSCNNDENPVECFQRLWDGRVTSESETAPRKIGQEIQDNVTPVNLESTATNSLTDFLSNLAAGVGIGSFNDDDDSWTFRFNPWSPYTPTSKSDFLVSVTAQEPALFPPLVTSLTEKGLNDSEKGLKEELGDLDDLSIAISWNRRSANFGRDFRSHSKLISEIYGSLAGQAFEEVGDEALVRLLGQLNRLEPGIESTDFERIPTAQAAVIEGLVVDAAAEQRAVDEILDASLGAVGFFRLADLINNQPQILASVTNRSRGEAVGPDELVGTIAAEVGLINMWTLKWFCNKTNRSVDAGCLEAYTREVDDAIAAAPRVSLEVEYADVDEFSKALPNDDFSFHVDGGHRTIASLNYGVYLRPDQPKESRFELEARYDDVSGDTMRRDRFIATATFIQKLANGTAASFSLVHANKPEYRGEVNEEISARFGLRYSIGGKKKE